MLSSSRTSASGGRKPMSTPSASHAVGSAGSCPVSRGAGRPGKPIGPGIEPGRHDDDLAQARLAGLGEIAVVEAGASGERVDHPRKTNATLGPDGSQLA